MKRISLLTLTLILAAGCGEAPDATSDAADGAARVEAPAAPEPASAPETGAPAEATAEPRDAPQARDRIELAQAATDLSAVEAAGFVQGRHYRRLSPAQPTSTSGGRVEVIEFFMHSCIHCYNLEPFIEAWLETKPDYIEFVRVPTLWSAGVAFHGQAFYTAKALGKLDEMQMPFFREFHEAGNQLTSMDAMAEFFSRFGVSREQFESTFESFAVNTDLRRAAELNERYRVDSTPTIIVNGKYETDVSMAGNQEQLIELINLLAAAERGQG